MYWLAVSGGRLTSPSHSHAAQHEASSKVVECEAAVEVAFLHQENTRHSYLLKEMTRRCQELMDKLTQLTNRYTELAHVIEVKNCLSSELQTSHVEVLRLKETHDAELCRLKDELEKTKTEAQDNLAQLNAQAHGKALEVEEHHQAALNEKDVQLKTANEKLEKEYQKHFIRIEDLKREHLEAAEKLRCRIQELQASLSSRTTSNMGIIAMKLQKSQIEHEVQLSEKEHKIQELETELRATKDNLHHQQMLSVVRGVPKTPTKQGKSPIDEGGIMKCSEVIQENSDFPDEDLHKDDEISEVVNSDAYMSESSQYINEPHNRTAPVTTPNPTGNKHKMVHKRKLFTGEYFMEKQQEN